MSLFTTTQKQQKKCPVKRVRAPKTEKSNIVKSNGQIHCSFAGTTLSLKQYMAKEQILYLVLGEIAPIKLPAAANLLERI
jgi:hypothetical protein